MLWARKRWEGVSVETKVLSVLNPKLLKQVSWFGTPSIQRWKQSRKTKIISNKDPRKRLILSPLLWNESICVVFCNIYLFETVIPIYDIKYIEFVSQK